MTTIQLDCPACDRPGTKVCYIKQPLKCQSPLGTVDLVVRYPHYQCECGQKFTHPETNSTIAKAFADFARNQFMDHEKATAKSRLKIILQYHLWMGLLIWGSAFLAIRHPIFIAASVLGLSAYLSIPTIIARRHVKQFMDASVGVEDKFAEKIGVEWGD